MSITLEKRKLTLERTSSIDYVDVEFTERASNNTFNYPYEDIDEVLKESR